MSLRSRLLPRCIAVAAVALCAIAPAHATYPERTITIVCASGAGGIVDVTTRIITDHMAKTLGHTVVVHNEPGAGGTLRSTPSVRPNRTATLAHDRTVGGTRERAVSQVDGRRRARCEPVSIVGDTPMVLLLTRTCRPPTTRRW